MTKDSATILLVEDEAPLAKALSLKLGSAGFEVTVAGDGQRALDLLAEHPYKLIILDLILPKKDGFEVLEELKSRGKMPPVLVMSNLGQAEDIERATKLGAAGYFVKSDTPLNVLVEQVKEHLEG